MPKSLLILTLILSTLAAAGCTTTRVISDNSVTAQFMRYDGLNGAHVTVGDGSTQRRPVFHPPIASTAGRPDLPPPTNPLANSVWSTNFKVDQPPSAGTVAPPHPPAHAAPTAPQPSLPTLGNSPLPDTSANRP